MTSRSHDDHLAADSHYQTSAPQRAWAVWLSTGLGVGYGPVMPGTYGSVLGVGLYLGLVRLLAPFPHARLLLVLAALAAVAASLKIVSIGLRSFRVQDPQEIVLDEVVGQLLTLLPLPLAPHKAFSYWMAVLVGFVLFRALDAAKPYPVWKLERLPGSWGVVCDDLGAGILGALCVAGMQWLGWKL